MAFNYVRARATAKRLIGNYGAAGTVVLKGIEAGKRNQDGSISTGTADTVISGIISPWVRASTFEINGDNIQAGDGFVFFHSDTTPIIGMQTTLNGVTHRVVGTKPITSVPGVRVSLQLQLRV